MTLDENSTHYDVLDLKPDASPQEVREAYLRAKATYNRDSVALYSLISAEERGEMLHRIEEAYEILSNPERRREYDLNYGMLETDGNVALPPRGPMQYKKVVSIDRVPPMEAESDDLLVAPATDFKDSEPPARELKQLPSPPMDPSIPTEEIQAPMETQTPPIQAPPVEPLPEPPQPPVAAAPPPFVAPAVPEPTPPPPPFPRTDYASRERTLVEDIAFETEYRGAFIRRIREMRRISIEEMASITKINKSYILALEEENYEKLPAVVFVRGFITQVAKTLRLPADKVVAAYLGRFSQARPEKSR